jgi:spermidine synthase
MKRMGRHAAVALLLVTAALAACSSQESAEGLVHQRDSQHGAIYVNEDRPGFRTLRFAKDGARQSVVKMGDPRHLALAYASAALTGLALQPQPQRILVVGLGGGSLPSFLRAYYPESVIDVAEIDRDVAEVAVQYFGFREDERMRIRLGDGRAYIEKVSQPYDLIMLDAFGAYSVPPHLATLEFLQAVRRALAPDGVAVGNVWSRGANPLYDAMVRTYEEAFEELYVISVQGDVNRIVLALPRRRGLDAGALAERARAVSTAQGFRFDLGDIVRSGWMAPGERRMAAQVLRDGRP